MYVKITKLAIALPLVAAFSVIQPLAAEARTRSIVKYGAIYLGARALYSAGQRSAYQPSYGYGYYPAPRYYGHSHCQSYPRYY